MDQNYGTTLSIRQVATCVEVMRSGSTSQAARKLGRTQPAVSSTTGTLEEEVGFAPFLREHGRLTPTPGARYFLEECEASLDRLDRTKRALGQLGALQRGRLRIACHPAASGVFLSRLLTDFLQDTPEVDVALVMRSSAVIEDLSASPGRPGSRPTISRASPWRSGSKGPAPRCRRRRRSCRRAGDSTSVWYRGPFCRARNSWRPARATWSAT